MGLTPDPELIAPITEEQARLVDVLRSRYADGVVRERNVLGQLSIWVTPGVLIDALAFLKDDPDLRFELLSDLTSVDHLPHRTEGEPRFEVIYNLYSITFNRRVLIKVLIDEKAELPTATTVWPGANFMEREVYDLMGIRFAGHPFLERVLTPDGWIGHPLRKDFPVRVDQFPNVES